MTVQTTKNRVNDLAARIAAIDLVTSALDHRGGLDEAFERPLFADLEPRDRALARMIAMTLLRRLKGIDRQLHAKLAKVPPDAVMRLLRLGAVQVLYMDTPSFAAVDTTVRLADRDRITRPFKGLINAVLRGLVREPKSGDDDPETLAPEWLFARWRATYGEDVARRIAARIIEEPATDLTLRDITDRTLIPELGAIALSGGSIRMTARGDVTAWSGYAQGRWWVQDAAAAVPARLLGVMRGETALDLCAAPGGKSLQLAAAGAKLTSLDRSASRLRRLRQSLERTGLSAEIIVADALSWNDGRQYEAVLLDAPCSATGTFRRHPDVLWGVRPSDIVQLAAIQSHLLDAASAKVQPRGRLVYCVCSLEPEEGEAQVQAFLARNRDFELDPIRPSENNTPEGAVQPEGWVRILPHQIEGGLDGFFVARLVRR